MNINNYPLLITIIVLVLVVFSTLLRWYLNRRTIDDSSEFYLKRIRRRSLLRKIRLYSIALISLIPVGYLIFYMLKTFGVQTTFIYIGYVIGGALYLLAFGSLFSFSRKFYFTKIKSSEIESAKLTWAVSFVLILGSLLSFNYFLATPSVKESRSFLIYYLIAIWVVFSIGSITFTLAKWAAASDRVSAYLKQRHSLETVISEIEVGLNRKKLINEVQVSTANSASSASASSSITEMINLLEQYDNLLDSID
jgi:hypothetical protein